ncbi:L-idonate 5-dehydrogenase [Jannaschia ovalis]|uniref:L-idonate 5-dehydrogenase n=1 Tax=Jannaschia ovalis TaxID=3038773 RepID=A0ABY8LG08_9RHOB|nr:L-idonate 5-dehydrogenase [Jannaschia sp. GRR-S6-38]WGH80213.1 L-idonate 5-dehydrogenase [Jannaschia sp. GRR-S6-38]
MRAIVIHAAHDLRLEERPDPGPPGPGQVRIRMAAGGVCGSDLHYYNHGGFGAVRLRQPMILGHEVAGHVDALGAGVEGLSEGQLVAISPSRPCGTCEYCLRGQPNQCLNMRFYGSAMPFPHIQGAFRDVLIAEATQCAPADGLSAGEAAMAEPLAVALHALRQAGGLVGKAVLVTGCGPIGLLTVLAARRAGAERIVATDLAGFPLDMARRLGADDGLDLKADPEALRPWQREKGQFDAAFECSGAAPALAGAIAALRPGGVLVQLGLGGDMPVSMQALTAKELSLKGSFRFHAEFHAGVSLMRKGLIDVTPLITHSLPLDAATDAFTIAGDRSQAMKAQIVFGA